MPLATVVLEGPGEPDVGTVDDVARLSLAASRLGGRAILTHVLPTLRELLELAGPLGAEIEGQAELGE